MYEQRISLFTYDEGMWRKRVLLNCKTQATSGSHRSTAVDIVNDDMVIIIVPIVNKHFIGTEEGTKEYISEKKYDHLESKNEFVTVHAARDFVITEENDLPLVISDDDYDSGLFNYCKENLDGVYLCNSVARFHLIPHLEIGGR